MDTRDGLESNLPAVPRRYASALPSTLDAGPFGQSAAEAPSQTVNVFRALFRAISRHWWQILLLWVIGTGGVCYVILTRVKPVYEAASLLWVEPAKNDIFKTGMYANESFLPFMETQVQLVTCSNVLSAALSEPNVQMAEALRSSEDQEGTLRSLLRVAIVPNSNLLRVAMSSPSSKECADIVNSVVSHYLSTALQWSEAMNRAQIKSLEAYQRELQAQAREKQDAWSQLASKGNIEVQEPLPTAEPAAPGQPTVLTKSRVTLDEYRKVRQELLQVNLDLTQAETLLTIREQEHEQLQVQSRGRLGGQGESHVEKAIHNDPEVIDLGRSLDRAKTRYDDVVRLTRLAGDPSRLNAQKKLNDLKMAYHRLIEAKREEFLARNGGDSDPLTPRELRDAREKVALLKATKASHEKILAQLDVTNRQEGSDQVKVTLLREDLITIKAMRDTVDKRLEQLRFDTQGETRIIPVDPARPTGIPVSDNRKKLMALTPVALLGLVVGFFVMLEVKIGRVSDLDDFSKVIPTEVFAMPPLPGPRLEPGQRGARERESRLLEFLQSLDHLRVSLYETPVANTGGRCLVVTSATESEGKTTLSAQFAACCAKAGISTLLIDADMRRCTLSRILNEAKSPGLSDVLQGTIAAEDAPVAVADAGFHLLPAGTTGRDPSWLLRGMEVSRALSRYRQLFDMIIIDTPPILPVPDALTLGRWSDGVVLTTRFDYSRMALVLKARRRMASAGIPVLKTVVNGVKTSRFSYLYGAYYGYGTYGGEYGAYDEQPAAAPEQTIASS